LYMVRRGQFRSGTGRSTHGRRGLRLTVLRLTGWHIRKPSVFRLMPGFGAEAQHVGIKLGANEERNGGQLGRAIRRGGRGRLSKASRWAVLGDMCWAKRGRAVGRLGAMHLGDSGRTRLGDSGRTWAGRFSGRLSGRMFGQSPLGELWAIQRWAIRWAIEG